MLLKVTVHRQQNRKAYRVEPGGIHAHEFANTIDFRIINISKNPIFIRIHPIDEEKRKPCQHKAIPFNKPIQK